VISTKPSKASRWISCRSPWKPALLSCRPRPCFGYVTDAAQKQAQEKLARLVPNAKITNTNSGHEIHKE
jgi:hypothetical protein